METTILSEICRKCAECCKNYPFVELSQNEIYELEKLTGLPFDMFTSQKGEAVGEYFLKFKENGDCFFLNENNGDYSCGVYEARSRICRNYPSKPGQNEVCDANREMILRNNSG
jgi:Fe-S-cluster containining protein